MRETFTQKFTVTVGMEKPIQDVTDVLAHRLYTLDGISDVTVAIYEAPEKATRLEPSDRDLWFDRQITEFNKLYSLPCPEVPTVGMAPGALDEYLEKVYSIFKDELDEVEAIRVKLRVGAKQTEILTELADWLGDLQVYCASEMRKFGLPNSMILSIIMASNMSKLGEDGKPIHDERGKVMKGPNYWKPEPMIHRALAALIRQHDRAQNPLA